MHQLNQVGGQRVASCVQSVSHDTLRNVDLNLHYIFPHVQSDDAVEKRRGDGLIFTSQQN